MNILLAVVLAIHPVLDDDATLRVAAAGVGESTVTWTLDGHVVATTAEREAATFTATAGTHNITAQADDATWTAMVRVEADGPGARFVPSWSASAGQGQADFTGVWGEKGTGTGEGAAGPMSAPSAPDLPEAPPPATWTRVAPIAAAVALAALVLARHPKQT